MKRSLVRLVFLAIAATNLSGCVVWPWWDRGRHEGEFRGERHERHEEHGGHGEHH